MVGAYKKPVRGSRTSTHSQAKASASMGEMMHKKVTKTNQMREKVPGKSKKT
jgi:hypothetical protein